MSRYLPALPDHRGRMGAQASEWVGWVNLRGRAYRVSGRKNVTYPYAGAIDEVEDRTGVYAILYDPSGRTRYVAYVGMSKHVRTELKTKYRDWDIVGDTYYPFAAQYIPGVEMAKEVESDLIRYYSPPWNVRFH